MEPRYDNPKHTFFVHRLRSFSTLWQTTQWTTFLDISRRKIYENVNISNLKIILCGINAVRMLQSDIESLKTLYMYEYTPHKSYAILALFGKNDKEFCECNNAAMKCATTLHTAIGKPCAKFGELLLCFRFSLFWFATKVWKVLQSYWIGEASFWRSSFVPWKFVVPCKPQYKQILLQPNWTLYIYASPLLNQSFLKAHSTCRAAAWTEQ